MTTEEIILFIIAVLIMLLGLAGSVLPGLPATPLCLIGVVGHRLYLGEEGASNWVILACLLITCFSLLLDYLATMIGAKKLGATWRGILGAVIGGVVGIFFALPGIILGPFIGAAAFELIGGRKWKEAGRAGAGAVLGIVAGAIGKIACCVAMICLFCVNVLWPG